MFEFFIYLFCGVSLTFILAISDVAEPLKPKEGFWARAMHCPMCIGFWSGILTSLTCDIKWYVLATTTSFSSYVVDIILTRIQYGPQETKTGDDDTNNSV